MNLFMWGDFRLSSGLFSEFKIECDVLTADDWFALANVIAENWEFGSVEPIATGGTRLALALQRYCITDHPLHLIVDDVMTTGASFTKQLGDRDPDYGIHGIVVFSRALEYPHWVTPMFQMWPGT